MLTFVPVHKLFDVKIAPDTGASPNAAPASARTAATATATTVQRPATYRRPSLFVVIEFRLPPSFSVPSRHGTNTHVRPLGNDNRPPIDPAHATPFQAVDLPDGSQLPRPAPQIPSTGSGDTSQPVAVSQITPYRCKG